MPAESPLTLIHHEPDNTRCPRGFSLKGIGVDVSERLDYAPGAYHGEGHFLGKWICDDCIPAIQAPVLGRVIDNATLSARLLAHVLIAKLAVHLPFYRHDFHQAGLAIPRSILAQRVVVTVV